MKSYTPIVLVKIGGSLITDKTKPFSLRQRALEVIAREVAASMNLGKRLILGHGAGSFAHVPAKKYRTVEGMVSENSLAGLAEVADTAAQLNRIVMKELLANQVPAVAVSPLSIMQAKRMQLAQISTQALEALLDLGALPVLYGDVILDSRQGMTIFSTERVLGAVAIELQSKGYLIEQIIHCGQTNGVYDAEGKTIERISNTTVDVYEESLKGSTGTDVTGGMVHKVEEALSLAQHGIPGLIIDGIEHGSLSQAIAGKAVLGTKIVWE